jgi:hypothetical protein
LSLDIENRASDIEQMWEDQGVEISDKGQAKVDSMQDLADSLRLLAASVEKDNTTTARRGPRGFWDQIVADAAAVIQDMNQVIDAASSAIKNGWFDEDEDRVVRYSDSSAAALARITKNTRSAHIVGKSHPDPEQHPGITIARP